jgi:hypothetical protein
MAKKSAKAPQFVSVELRRVFTFQIDVDAEEKRLRVVWFSKRSKGVLQRQLAILQELRKGRWPEALAKYEALPYNNRLGCPEQEFTGLWIQAVRYGESFNDAAILNWQTSRAVQLTIPDPKGDGQAV